MVSSTFTVTNPSAKKPMHLALRRKSCTCLLEDVLVRSMAPRETSEIVMRTHAGFITSVNQLSAEYRTGLAELPTVTLVLRVETIGRIIVDPVQGAPFDLKPGEVREISLRRTC